MRTFYNCISLAALLWLSTTPMYGQYGDLKAALDAAKNNITDVTAQKYEYSQQLDYDPDQPWSITVTVDEVYTKKGSSDVTKYKLNLADIGPRLINYESDKDELTVVLKTNKRQELIRETNDDGDVDYQSEVSLYATDIDQATKLRDQLRQAAELAKAAWETSFQIGSTLPELNTYLADNITDFSVSDRQFAVSWSGDVGGLADYVELVIQEDDEETRTYAFSLSDIAKNSPELSISRDEVTVDMGTVARQRVIRETEEGEDAGYTSELSVPVADIDAARRLITVLTAALPLARDVQQQRLPEPASLTEAASQLSALVNAAKLEGREVSLDAEAVATLTTSEDEDNNRYLFDYGDLKAKSIDLDDDDGILLLNIGTNGGKDFIQTWENDEPDGFVDDVSIPLASVEDYRQAEALLNYLIATAADRAVTAEDLNWITTALTEADDEELTQALTTEAACKWTLTNTDEDGEETAYEFNLYNLDAKDTELSVERNQVKVTLPTIKGEDIINVFEDDEPSFTDEVALYFGSLMAGKTAVVTLRALVEACAE